MLTEAELEEMRSRAKGKKWPEKVGEHFEKELKKLRKPNRRHEKQN